MRTTFPCPEIVPELTKIYKQYQALWRVDVTMYEIGNARLVFPLVNEALLNELCKGIKELFQQEPSMLKLNENCVIMGDLHGHILDLFRVLKKFGTPPNTNYVILGDLIDRGEFSLETVTIVFVMKALFPTHVHLVRGNHEFPAMFQYNGFSAQVDDTYANHTVTYAFASAFAYMPFAALVFGKILCVHGGIGAGFTSVLQIDSVARPVVNFDTDPVISCVWSDPKVDVAEGFQESTRGIGFFFGQSALNNFLNSQGLTTIVRGHEPCEGGIKEMFDGRLITVFGASNYCNSLKNKSGVLFVSKNGTKITPTTFNPITYVFRSSAAFSSLGQTQEMLPSHSQPISGKSQKSLPSLGAANGMPKRCAKNGPPTGSSRANLPLTHPLAVRMSRSSPEMTPGSNKTSIHSSVQKSYEYSPSLKHGSPKKPRKSPY